MDRFVDGHVGDGQSRVTDLGPGGDEGEDQPIRDHQGGEPKDEDGCGTDPGEHHQGESEIADDRGLRGQSEHLLPADVIRDPRAEQAEIGGEDGGVGEQGRLGHIEAEIISEEQGKHALETVAEWHQEAQQQHDP